MVETCSAYELVPFGSWIYQSIHMLGSRGAMMYDNIWEKRIDYRWYFFNVNRSCYYCRSLQLFRNVMYVRTLKKDQILMSVSKFGPSGQSYYTLLLHSIIREITFSSSQLHSYSRKIVFPTCSWRINSKRWNKWGGNSIKCLG